MVPSFSQGSAWLKQDAKALNLVEFWEQRADVDSPAAQQGAPVSLELGRYRAAAARCLEDRADRRMRAPRVGVCQPQTDGKPYITNTLFAAYSLYNPGERAPVHRHTPSASRFVLDGDGGFTVVEGEKLRMSRGDLILTPTGTWHDHGNDREVKPVIWVDVLNVPLVESLNATSFEFNYTEQDKAIEHRRGRPAHAAERPPAGRPFAAALRHRWHQAVVRVRIAADRPSTLRCLCIAGTKPRAALESLARIIRAAPMRASSSNTSIRPPAAR